MGRLAVGVAAFSLKKMGRLRVCSSEKLACER